MSGGGAEAEWLARYLDYLAAEKGLSANRYAERQHLSRRGQGEARLSFRRELLRTGRLPAPDRDHPRLRRTAQPERHTVPDLPEPGNLSTEGQRPF